MWHAGSDVMGCRRPTGGVFSYVSSDRVTLRAFPVATPRGRSSSSHEGELLLSLQDISDVTLVHIFFFYILSVSSKVIQVFIFNLLL